MYKIWILKCENQLYTGNYMVKDGSIVKFVRTKDYVVVNSNLGSGALGKTVLLKDSFTDTLLVAKKYEPQCEEHKEAFYKNFLDEIKILFKLNHKNIVRIYNYYPYEELHTGYILMEHIEGFTLDEYFSYIGIDDYPVDTLFIQLIDAFEYLEKNNIIHRDIRPENILIANGPTPIVKIIDFGLGKIQNTVSIPKKDSLAKIISKEHVHSLPDDFYTEIYDFQTEMYYLADVYFTFLHNMSDEAKFSYFNILEKMRKKNKNERFISFTEIKEELNKKQIHEISASDNEKVIYRDFTNSILNHVASITNKIEFEQNIDTFIKKIENTLRLNQFEDYIVNPSIGFTFILGKFSIYKNRPISYDIVKLFYNWFTNLNSNMQKIVYENMLNKFYTIQVKVEDEFDIPF